MGRRLSGATLLMILVPLSFVSAQVHQSARRKEGLQAAKGDAAASLKMTDLSYEDRKAWRNILQWPDSCERDFDSHGGAWAGLQFWEVSPRQYLVEVHCFLAAYQPNQVYMYYDETKSPPSARLLTFTIYTRSGEKIVPEPVTDVAGVGEFDSKKSELTIATKFRGLGDCGSVARYKIENGSAVLNSFEAQFRCGEGGEASLPYKRIFPR